jgi:hypothetical protein
MGFNIRRKIITSLDHLKFRSLTTRYFFDRPTVKYHPLPFAGISDSKRAEGSITRMQKIQEFLQERKITDGFAMDCGCNVGYFSISLAQAGFNVFGIEEDARSLSIAYSAAQLANGLFSPLCMRITPNTARYLPEADVTLCLSIWHHWVKAYGIEETTDLLKTLFQKTHKVMFFDTGEHEMPENYNLPFQNKNPKDWLETYFKEALSASEVVWLGQHKAFAPGAKKDEFVMRSLFAVVK